MDGEGFTETVVINGMDCQFNPTTKVALIYCSNCSHANEVECDIIGGEVVFQGFVCEKCNTWNAPE